MRLIDADAIEYTMLYKENWLKGTGVEAQAVWKDSIDAMPTVEAIPIEWLESWFEKHNRLTLFYIILGDWERNEGNH